MLVPTLPGWKVETVGDDICWMKPGADGRLHAINPEAGFFGVAPGTNMQTNPNADALDRGEHDLHEHRAHARRRHLVGGHGRDRPRDSSTGRASSGRTDLGTPAAHPNSRFTAPASQDPAIAAEWEDPAGVPIDAILFGGRRACVVPLISQSFSWDHGVFLGSILSSETTAAATGAVGKLRRDPFAMLPFCGYNMADYFAHWLTFAERNDEANLPKIFYVNWFRKGADGTLPLARLRRELPRARVGLRAHGRSRRRRRDADRLRTDATALNVEGLDVSPEDLTELLTVDHHEWHHEIPRIQEHFAEFGDDLPAQFHDEVKRLEAKLH